MARLWEMLKGKLIVSCQALPGEPLCGPQIMAKMALAAKIGGAAAIRAQGAADIRAIRQEIDLPIIGLIKKQYPSSPVYITPTAAEVAELLGTPAEIIALDMTGRCRPGGERAADLVKMIHRAGRLALGDISTAAEARQAAADGADAVSTTLAGYTDYSRQLDGPDVELVAELAGQINIPVLAEGRIATPAELAQVMRAGAYAAVIGGAITRPQLITAKFSAVLG